LSFRQRLINWGWLSLVTYIGSLLLVVGWIISLVGTSLLNHLADMARSLAKSPHVVFMGVGVGRERGVVYMF
jgi:hypothetical protein